MLHHRFTGRASRVSENPLVPHDGPISDPVEAAPQVADDAHAAFDALTGGGGLEDLTLRDLAEFLGYQLPVKWLVGLDEHLAMVAGLGRLFELLELPRYARLCGSEEVRALLVAYDEGGSSAARKPFRRLLDQTGVEPPDTLLFRWGSVMGPEEAAASWSTSAPLELALQAGELVVGARGWRDTAQQLTGAHLVRDRPELGGSWLVRVRQERLDGWVDASRGPRRRALAEAFAEAVRDSIDLIDVEVPVPVEAEHSLAPLHWLLGEAETGAPLTATSALKPTLVREFCALFPHLWPFPGSREVDVPPLLDLRALASDLGAVRRKGDRLWRTDRGQLLRESPEELWVRVADELLRGKPAEATAAELALLLLLTDEGHSSSDLNATIADVLAAEGWRVGGERDTPDDRDAAGLLMPLRGRLYLLDLVSRSEDSPVAERLNEAGRAAAIAALRGRALGPVHSVG